MKVLEYPLLKDETTTIELPVAMKVLGIGVVNNTPMLNVLDYEITDETHTRNYTCYEQFEVFTNPDVKYIGSCVLLNKQYHVFENA